MKRCFHRKDIFDEMVQCFWNEVDESLSRMTDALNQDNLAEVGRIGHRLKATVAYLGAEEVQKAARQVEHFERNSGTKADAQQAVNLLHRLCEELKRALQQDGHAPETPESNTDSNV